MTEAKPKGPGYTDDQWMRRLESLTDEMEEELWFYAQRKGKDRVGGFMLYLDLLLGAYRRLTDKTEKRKTETFRDKVYQGEKN